MSTQDKNYSQYPENNVRAPFPGAISPRAQIALVALSLLTLVIMLIWGLPYGLGLFYQLAGGQELDQAIRASPNIDSSDIFCAVRPVSNGDALAKVERARTQLETALDHQPNLAQARLLLARANCLMGELNKAVAGYLEYTKLRPRNPLGHLELGFAYEALGDQPAAVRSWSQAGLTVQDFYEDGVQLYEAKQIDEALQWFDRATLMDPEHAMTWLLIGEIYEELGEWERALQHYQVALGYDAELAATATAKTLSHQGENEAAEQVLRQALKDYPGSQTRLQWWRALGDNLKTRAMWDEAVQVYQEAVSEFPNEHDLHVSLAEAYYERGDGIQWALAELNKAIALSNKSAHTYFIGGQLLSRDKRYDEADYWFLRALQRNPNVWYFYLGRANNARSARDLDLAIEIYLETIERFPDLANAYYNLAIAYQLVDKPQKAIEAINQAIKLIDPPTDTFYVRAGDIYFRMGDTDSALAAYFQALAINPDNDDARRAVLQLGGSP